MDYGVAVADSYGNISDLQTATNGERWDVIESKSGHLLKLGPEPTSSMNEIEIKNTLASGSINAQIYKDGKLLATKTGISPQQKAVFEFKPVIYVGVVKDIVEGSIMNSAVVSSINHEFSLLGITKANLIMTGGGTGPESAPFQFELVPTS